MKLGSEMGKTTRDMNKSQNCSEWKDAGFLKDQILQEMEQNR